VVAAAVMYLVQNYLHVNAQRSVVIVRVVPLEDTSGRVCPEVRDDTSVQASVQTTVQLVLEPVLGLVLGMVLGLVLGLIFSRTATNPDSSTSRDSEASSLWCSIVTLLSLSKDDMAIHYFDVSNSMTSML
jgi:hypothetical protein